MKEYSIIFYIYYILKHKVRKVIKIMQRQPSVKEQLSRKSCGILYKLKTELQKRKLTLQRFIGEFFGYQKQKFSRKDFEQMIKKYDENLIYDDIDMLFEELDDCKNGCIFYNRLKQAYKDINETDNPLQKSRGPIDKIISLFKQPTQQQVISQLRSTLLASEDLFQIIDLFASQTVGYLTVQNVIEIFKSFQFNDQEKRRRMIGYLFETKAKISVEMFNQKLNLNTVGTRVDIKKLDQSRIMEDNKNTLNQSIDETMKSRFIQQKLRESSRMDEEISHTLVDLDLKSIKSKDQYISLENIPLALQQYFNYGSVLEPEFALISSQYIQHEQFFIDTENPPYTKAFQYIHFSQLVGDNYTLFKPSQSVLFRDKNRKGLGQLLQSKHIIQGALGDCYFMSAISAIVERYPQLVYRLFVLDRNPSHLYGVRLFVNGQWKTVLLDLCFPIDINGRLCAAQPYKNQLWVMLLEKAWAKIFGSYDAIHSGYNEQGLNAIAGAPSIHISSRDDGFLKTLQVHLKKGAIITCATSAEVQQMTQNQQHQLGIYSNHAYTLLGVFSNLKYNNGRITLLKVRNPWGRKQWKGDWGYYSSLWTKQLRQYLNYNMNPKDGSFFMSHENFTAYFDFVNICQVNLSYVNSYLTFETERNQFKTIRVKITQKGDYFFTQYQQNPRKYKNSFNYQKSKSWMFLSKIDKDQRIAIGSRSTEYRDNTLEATLQVGEYLLMARVGWKYWEKHEYTLTSYGPARVEFVLDNSNKYSTTNELADFITSKSTIGLGKVSGYDSIAASKRIYMDSIQGYGFLQISNFESQVLSTGIQMSPCKGITILPPYQLPMKLQVFPNQNVIVKFIVDPSGYAYQYRQSYYLY